MPNAFGFQPLPQRPSPDPRAVGQALARASFSRAGTTMAPTPPSASPSRAVELPSNVAGQPDDRLRQLFRTLSDPSGREILDREIGGREMGGAGQTGTGSAPPGQPDYPIDEEEAHSAMHATIGEAATRIANGVMQNMAIGPQQRARRRAQLEHLGLAPFELDVLSRSGGL